LWEHNNDNNALAYTHKRRPVTLKYFQRFDDIKQAIEFEKQIKGWSRKKKEALFDEDWEALKKAGKISFQTVFDKLRLTAQLFKKLPILLFWN
jgi:predicted GIY-YIG superfamily endonuclease